MNMEYPDFQIVLDKNTIVLHFIGILRSNNFEEFDKIKNFILDVYELKTPELIMDFTKLEFMNSAGISTLCRFILEVKDKSQPKPVKIIGKKDILWQVKSFENLKKIWNNLLLEFQ